jgi:hypothetical protein
MSVHAYVLDGWRRTPLFLDLAKVTCAPNAANLTELIVSILQERGGLDSEQLARKCVGGASDGAAVLQGAHSGVMTRLADEFAPFIESMHCSAHRFSLAAGVLDKVVFIGDLRQLMQNAAAYFARSSKRCSELRLAAVAAGTHSGQQAAEVRGDSMVEHVQAARNLVQRVQGSASLLQPGA